MHPEPPTPTTHAAGALVDAHLRIRSAGGRVMGAPAGCAAAHASRDRWARWRTQRAEGAA